MVNFESGIFSLDEFIVARGYHNPLYKWNGWESPCFELSTIPTLIETLNRELGDSYKFIRNEHSVTVIDVNYPDEPITMDDMEIIVDGNSKIVNSLNDAFCWFKISEKELIEFETKNKLIKITSLSTSDS